MKQNQITILLRSKLSILNSSIVQVTVKINFRVLLEKFWAIILPYIGNLWKALLTRYSRTDNWRIFRYFWYFRKEKKTELSCRKSERTIFTDVLLLILFNSLHWNYFYFLFVCLFVCLKRSLQQKIHNWKKVFPRKEKLSFRGRRGIQVQEHAHIIIDRFWRAESIKYYIDCNSLIAQMAVLKIHFSEWFVNVQVIGPQISISFSSFTAPTSPKTKENKTTHFRTVQLKLFPLIFIVIYVPFDHLGKFSMIGLWWKFKMGKKYIISPKSWAIHVHRVHVTQTNDSLPLISELNEENFLPCSEKVRIYV